LGTKVPGAYSPSNHRDCRGGDELEISNQEVWAPSMATRMDDMGPHSNVERMWLHPRNRVTLPPADDSNWHVARHDNNQSNNNLNSGTGIYEMIITRVGPNLTRSLAYIRVWRPVTSNWTGWFTSIHNSADARQHSGKGRGARGKAEERNVTLTARDNEVTDRRTVIIWDRHREGPGLSDASMIEPLTLLT
jgi:hypothetical protein